MSLTTPNNFTKQLLHIRTLQLKSYKHKFNDIIAKKKKHASNTFEIW